MQYCSVSDAKGTERRGALANFISRIYRRIRPIFQCGQNLSEQYPKHRITGHLRWKKQKAVRGASISSENYFRLRSLLMSIYKHISESNSLHPLILEIFYVYLCWQPILRSYTR